MTEEHASLLLLFHHHIIAKKQDIYLYYHSETPSPPPHPFSSFILSFPSNTHPTSSLTTPYPIHTYLLAPLPTCLTNYSSIHVENQYVHTRLRACGFTNSNISFATPLLPRKGPFTPATP